MSAEFIKRELGLPDLQEAYDDTGYKRPLLNRSADGTIYGLSNALLQKIGRSRQEVAPDAYFTSEHTEDTIEGGCPWAIRSAAVSPKNHLVACCGMEAEHNAVLDFGALDANSPAALVAAANRSILVRVIAHLGPLFLKRFLARFAPEVSLSLKALSMCSLCEEIVSSPAAQEALHRHQGALSVYLLRAEQT